MLASTSNLCFFFCIILFSSRNLAKPLDNKAWKHQTGSVYHVIIVPRAIVPQHEHWLFFHVERSRILVSIEMIGIRQSDISYTAPRRVLKGGYGRLSVHLPYAGYTEPYVGLGIAIFDCEKLKNDLSCLRKPGPLLLRQWKRVRVIQRPVLLHVDVHRPVYRPGETVRFHVVGVFTDTLRPSDKDGRRQPIHFDRIYLESASQLRVAEWRNVTWLDAFKGFRSTLAADAVLGTWRLVAAMTNSAGQWMASRQFEVMNYAPPDIIVEAKPPDFLRSIDRFAAFSVCARTTAGQPVKARVAAKFCVRSRRYPLPDAPCIHVKAKLKRHHDCVYFNESTRALRLQDRRLEGVAGHRYAFLEASVTTDGDNRFVSRSAFGGRLVHFVCSVELHINAVYQPGLPHYGSVVTRNPDGDVCPRARVHIEALSNKRAPLGQHSMPPLYSVVVKTDKKGRATFAVPAGILTCVHCVIRATTLSSGEPTITQSIVHRAASSSNNAYLQLLRLPESDDEIREHPCRLSRLQVQLQSTVPLHQHSIQLLILSAGDVYMTHAVGPSGNTSQCWHKDSNALGHYQCIRRRPSDGRWLVRCRTGWHGPNCLTPVCSDGCVRGVCVRPDECHCQPGWSGRACNRCKRHPRCVHGYCYRGDDCRCLDGWAGPYCDEMSFRPFYNLLRPSRHLRARKVPYPRRRKLQLITVYQRNLDVRFDRPLGSGTHLVVLVRLSSQRELLGAMLPLPGASKCLSQSAVASFNFHRPVARPGESVPVRLTLPGHRAQCSLAIRDALLETLELPQGLQMDHVSQAIAESLEERRTGGEKELQLTAHQCSVDGSHEKPEASGGTSHKLVQAGVHLISGLVTSSDPCAVHSERQSWRECEAEADELRRGLSEATDDITASPISSLMSSDAVVDTMTELKRSLATYWPSVWRFDFLPKPDELKHLTAPHSLTTWHAQLVCVSSSGLSVAPTATLVVYQPFLAQMQLPPHGIVFGETLVVVVLVRSFTTECIELRLDWRYSKFFKLEKPDYARLCLCEFGERSLNFTLTPRDVGKILLTLRVSSIPTDNCKPRDAGSEKTDVPGVVKDTITRNLTVRRANPNVVRLLSATTNYAARSRATVSAMKMPFELQTKLSSKGGKCERRQVQLCLNNRSPDIRAVMMVVKVKMASGWNLRWGTVSALKRSSRSIGLRMVRTDLNGTLILLYDFYSTFRPRCAEFGLIRHFRIMNLKPMLIELFDFSQPEAAKRRILSLNTLDCPPLTLRPKEKPMRSSSYRGFSALSSVRQCPHCRLDNDTLNVLIETICETDHDDWSILSAHYLDESANWLLTALGDSQLERWSGIIRVPSHCRCRLSRRLLLVVPDEKVRPGHPVMLNGRWSVIDSKRVSKSFRSRNIQGFCRAIIEAFL